MAGIESGKRDDSFDDMLSKDAGPAIQAGPVHGARLTKPVERRFFFNVNNESEIVSSLGQTETANAKQKGARPVSAAPSRSQVQPVPNFKRPASAISSRTGKEVNIPEWSLSTDASMFPKNLAPKFKVQMSYYSVQVDCDEVNGPKLDYTKDFRRFAYRDFALGDYTPGSNIPPETLLKWVLKAKPRNQDDVYPIMQLCKGILRDLMQNKLTCRLESEHAFHEEISALKGLLDKNAKLEVDLRLEIEHLRRSLSDKDKEIDDLLAKVASTEKDLLDRESQISNLKRSVDETNHKQSDLRKTVSGLEKQLQSANIIAEQRLRDYTRAQNSLTARLQMTVKDIVLGWKLEEKYQCFVLLIQESPANSCIGKLTPSDFQACHAEVRVDIAKKLLSAIKVSSQSWLMAISELFGCKSKDLHDKVVSWYENEGMITDEIKYHKQIEHFKTAFEGTDFTPIYDILKQSVILGKLSVNELVFNCSGKTREETMLSMTEMSLDEVNLFKQRRKEILAFVQMKMSNEAKEKQEHSKLRNLGFLHHHVVAADPMEISCLNGFIAKIFARKIAQDIDNGDHGKKRLNIMKVTKNLMVEMYNRTADVKMQISKLVAGVKASQNECPRVGIFGILAGMDPSKPWFERSSCFMMEFVTLVVEKIHEDPEVLADFRKRNHLMPFKMMPPNTDRIEWTLTNHDFKVPLIILLNAAMRACEEHPCGYGYPRDHIQEIVDQASKPSSEYIEVQKRKIREARDKYEEVKKQQTFDRLAGKGSRAGQKGEEDPKSKDTPGPSASGTVATHAERGRTGRRVSATSQANRGESADSIQLQHDFGVSFESHWNAWFDVFCHGLLLAWFEQHFILEAQMSHIFDVFDENGNGTIEFDEFKRLMDNSPMASKYNERQLLHMFSELTSHDGLLTKYDWINIFHHVQFDVLTMIRPRRNSIRRMLVTDISDDAALDEAADAHAEEAAAAGSGSPFP